MAVRKAQAAARAAFSSGRERQQSDGRRGEALSPAAAAGPPGWAAASGGRGRARQRRWRPPPPSPLPPAGGCGTPARHAARPAAAGSTRQGGALAAGGRAGHARSRRQPPLRPPTPPPTRNIPAQGTPSTRARPRGDPVPNADAEARDTNVAWRAGGHACVCVWGGL